jgi:hypothetical protein
MANRSNFKRKSARGKTGNLKKKQARIASSTGKNTRPTMPPSKPQVGFKRNIIVYGMKLDPEHITRAAVEAYNKRRYTVHDMKLTDYIPDPKFRNLMVKIAVLDRIEEEVLSRYPEATVIRPNTVTLMVR